MEHGVGRVLRIAAACTALCVLVCAGVVVSIAATAKRATTKVDTIAHTLPDASAHLDRISHPQNYTVVLLLGCLAAVACAT